MAVDSRKMNAAAANAALHRAGERGETKPAPPRPHAASRGRILHQRLMFALMTVGMLAVLVPTVYVFYNIFANGYRQMISSTELRAGSIEHPAKLAAAVKAGTDPVSAFLRDQIPAESRALLDAYGGSGEPSRPLRDVLIDTLNEQIRGRTLYTEERFASVTLRAETQRLVTQNKPLLAPPGGGAFDPFGVGGGETAAGDAPAGTAASTGASRETLIELNRSLLEDAYPGIISKSRFSTGFLTKPPLDNGLRGGIGPAIAGTFALMMGTIVLALPLGIFAAIYLTEYARKGPVIRLIRMAIVNLAGVPSIVHGLFGLGLFIYFFGAKMDQIFNNTRPVWQNQTLLWGSATLAVLVLPVVITATEEALLSVPRSFREGSMGLGATKWQTIRKVVLPAAVPGILTGAILAVGRAAGETAPILLTAALSWTSSTGLPKLSEPVMALPYHLYYVVTQVANAPLRLQYGIAMTLLLLVFFVNLTAIILRARLRRARKW